MNKNYFQIENYFFKVNLRKYEKEMGLLLQKTTTFYACHLVFKNISILTIEVKIIFCVVI